MSPRLCRSRRWAGAGARRRRDALGSPTSCEEPRFGGRWTPEPLVESTGTEASAAEAPAAEAAPEPEAAELHSVVGDGGHTTASTSPSRCSTSADAEGARLIALNMALNGTPREETARYLSENFHLSDAGGLLDEVYASVES